MNRQTVIPPPRWSWPRWSLPVSAICHKASCMSRWTRLASFRSSSPEEVRATRRPWLSMELAKGSGRSAIHSPPGRDGAPPDERRRIHFAAAEDARGGSGGCAASTPQLHHDACGVGFLAEMEGRPTTRLLPLALTALDRLAHRGAVDADGRTGAGAGVTTQIPYDVLRPQLEARALARVAPRDPAVGLVFLPADGPAQARARQLLADAVTGRGLSFLGWREVPFRDEVLGDKARRSRPAIAQALIERPKSHGVTPSIGDDELEG